MREPKPALVELSREEYRGLETLVGRYSTPQQLARSGRIVLSAAAGLNNSQVARKVGLAVAVAVAVATVRFWRNRWLGLRRSAWGTSREVAMRLSNKASWSGFPTAMRPVCWKGGPEIPPDTLLSDTLGG